MRRKVVRFDVDYAYSHYTLKRQIYSLMSVVLVCGFLSVGVVHPD